MVRVWDFNSCPDSACTAVNLIADISDLAGKNSIAGCVYGHVHLITCLQTGEVMFENVGDDPNSLKIDNHERSGAVSVDHCSDREIPFDQRAGDRRGEWKFGQWLAVVGPLELADLACGNQ